MSFATEYLAQLQAFAATQTLPRIRALHLPPRQTITDNRGEFCALELEDGSIGQSYVLFDDSLQRLANGADIASLSGASALDVAQRYAGTDSAWATVGFAAANALTHCLFRRADFTPPASSDSVGDVQAEPGDHIGMIGLFKPLLPAILKSGAQLTVVELNPALAGAAEGYRVTLDASELTHCNKVVSTSTLLLNHTLDRMLAHCANAHRFAMIGPSAGCLPDALFARGVTLVGGSWVTDSRGFVDALLAGDSRHAFARKFALTPGNYPGYADLLKMGQ